MGNSRSCGPIVRNCESAGVISRTSEMLAVAGSRGVHLLTRHLVRERFLMLLGARRHRQQKSILNQSEI